MTRETPNDTAGRPVIRRKIIIPNKEGYWFVDGGPLAPEGHIRAFDADAKGMVRGSGAAV